MIIIKKQEFIDWIKAQSDDRPMDFRGSSNNDSCCKCPMVQYAQDIFPKEAFPEEWACGFSVWEDQNKLGDEAIFAKFEGVINLEHIVKGGIFNTYETFGELKKNITE